MNFHARWQYTLCLVAMPLAMSAAGCSPGGQSAGPTTSPPGLTSTSPAARPTDAAPTEITSSSTTTGAASPAAAKLTSGILALTSVGDKRTYGFIDPDSGQYAEAVTFTIPSSATAQGTAFAPLAASPDLTKYAVTTMTGGQSAAGWIDASGQFTAVTPTSASGPFGGNPPSFSAIGFDGTGNFFYKENAQGAMYTEVYMVPAGTTGNPQQITTTPAGAVDRGAALNSDGHLLFGCDSMTGSWLDATTRVMAIAPGTQIAKVPISGRGPGGCPTTAASSEVPLLPTSNTATVHDPVVSSDGTKVAFLYDDPDTVRHNFPSVYIVGTSGGQPTLVNLSESDAKKLTGATLLRWS